MILPIMARASILITPVMSELLARIQQVQTAARVTDICSRALLLGLSRMAESTVVQDVAKVNKLDDFAYHEDVAKAYDQTKAVTVLKGLPVAIDQKMTLDELTTRMVESGAGIQLSPEGLAKLDAMIDADKQVERSQPPSYKHVSFGVKPEVIVEVKPSSPPPGEPVSFIAPTWPVEPESEPKAIVEPAAVVESPGLEESIEASDEALFTAEKQGLFDDYDLDELIK